MSFALTEAQLLAGTKDVTRRLGWKAVLPGERVTAIRKGMGLARGEKQVVLATLQVVSVRREPLDDIQIQDVDREGFPELTRAEFIEFFCRANGCKPDTVVTRIEFRTVERLGQEPASMPPADLGGVRLDPGAE